MIIGKRRLKQIKLILVSPTLEKITMMYETYGLGNGYLNLYQIKSQFQVYTWRNSTTVQEAFNYLMNVFTPKYYANQFKSSHIPLSNLIIAQTRSTIYQCNTNVIDCEYGSDQYQEVQFQALDTNNCVSENCSEFIQSQKAFGGIKISVDGHYQTYYDFNYYSVLKIADNYTNFYRKLIENNWIDNHTESIGIFGSIYDLNSKQQVQVNFLLEQQFAKYPLYLSETFFQMPFYDFQDTLHILLFSYLIFIGLLKIFRTMLELTYIFSRFNFVFQLYNFTSLIVYVIVHFQILIVRDQAQDENLLFSKTVLENNFNGKILSVGPALLINEYQTTEDVGKVLLLLSYPYSFVQFILFFNTEWIQNYHTLQMRTMPGLLICTILSISFYILTFLPQSYLDKQYRTGHHSINYIAYIFAQLFLDNYQDNEDQKRLLSLIIEILHFIFQSLIVLYVIGLSIEGFRKASIYEMPYQTKYDKEFIQNFDNLNIKINKVLKQVQKLFIKEKQSQGKKISRREEDKQSQILDDEETLSDMSENKSDKILIVFEINNGFLEDINRFKARRDANQYAQKRIKYSKSNKEQASSQKIRIIQSLLQKDKVNQRLQVMLSKHQTNEAQYTQLQEDQVEQNNDFFQSFKEQISDQGVKIREFTIIDQVIKFLEMLLRLRPEFLSLNAEQRIRIMFYINSDQVEEDDVYKLLSFLIVNLAKQHLNYPILVFSCHKEWYIEKAQYLKLKKFYRNIFSTLEKECALEFSLMQTSFFDFQLKFSKDQQFYEKDNQEEISNSMIEEGEDKSELL
ncbi:unnamed protein product [Paramecium sonneborni]|uniref:Transmembrane protein n=1 Tax=Paramecium sonneborni TaxID=65129 RepID=A0A8S1MIT0_9CILI|nr:unnamed protein product [Paramecium sonneborni]